MLQQWWMGFDALWLALDEIHRTAKSRCACVVITAHPEEIRCEMPLRFWAAAR
jgi:hypothetical protein